MASSSCLLIYSKLLKFPGPNGSKSTSFSIEFSFTMSHGYGDGISFVVLPYNSEFKFVGQGLFRVLSEVKYLGIEYDTKMDGNVGD